MKKCKKCGAPLEGFLYNTIGKLMGIKPSAGDPEICNKCAANKTENVEAKPVEETPVVPAEEKTAMPVEEIKTEEAEEKKEDNIL